MVKIRVVSSLPGGPTSIRPMVISSGASARKLFPPAQRPPGERGAGATHPSKGQGEGQVEASAPPSETKGEED